MFCTGIGDNGDNGDVEPILSETLPDMISVKELVSWIGLEFPSCFPLKIFKGTIKFLSIFSIDVQFPFFFLFAWLESRLFKSSIY